MCEWDGCEVCVCMSGVVGYFATCVSYYDPIVEFSMQECIMFVAILSHSEVSYHATDGSIRANWQLFPDCALNPNYGTV